MLWVKLVHELHMWHALAAWLILFPAGISIILTVSVPVSNQAFSWSFPSQEAVWEQIVFFTLGFTPARLTPLTQDNSSREGLWPCLHSRVPVPCWGTHNSHHCQDPIKTPCHWSAAQSSQYLGYFKLKNEWKIMIVLCISWSSEVQISCSLSCINCEGGVSPFERVPALSSAYVCWSSPGLLGRVCFSSVSSQPL